VLECVINISEGRSTSFLEELALSVSQDLLDIHTDSDHNRSVFTLVGPTAPRELVALAASLLTLETHTGVHPRLGVIDVVPFVPLVGSTMDDAIQARDAFAQWASKQLGIPCFLYGPERTLPDIRRLAWSELMPDTGEKSPHPTAGAICVGAREPLVAYNLWLENVDIATTKKIAALVRTAAIRTLGLQVGLMTQVSVNLVALHQAGPSDVYDAVAQHAKIHHAELVGLAPAHVLASIPRHRWEELDLSVEKTIESRLAKRQ